MHFLLQFGGDKQENGIRLWGKNKRLKSIVKTGKRRLKCSKKNLSMELKPEANCTDIRFETGFKSSVGFTKTFFGAENIRFKAVS
jgi:hypothetical protein